MTSVHVRSCFRLAAAALRRGVPAGRNAKLLAQTAPAVLLDAVPPVLLDEWQLVPDLWNHVRRAVDEGGEAGRFILAGSAQPADDLTRHSGAGRFARMRIRPLAGSERAVGTHDVAERFPETAISRAETVAGYLAVVERLWILEYQPAFAPHLRSSIRLRSTPVMHLADPALAVAALAATPDSLLRDLNFMGLLFESMVLRDLRVFTHHQLAEIQHYRDENGLEVDAIVSGEEGRWCAMEIKLGSTPAVVDAAAASLLKFAARIDTERMGKPAALVVVTGTGPGFVRPDGVVQVPYGALAP